jgi:hypothetical protein
MLDSGYFRKQQLPVHMRHSIGPFLFTYEMEYDLISATARTSEEGGCLRPERNMREDCKIH